MPCPSSSWRPFTSLWGFFVSAGLIASFLSANTRGQSAATPPARQVPEGLNYANGLVRERRYELAAQEYERFLKETKNRADAADARFGLANARLFQGEYAKARTEFETLLKEAPNHPSAGTAWYRVGETAYMLRDLEASKRAFETFTSNYPKHKHLDTAWPYFGDVCLGLLDLDRAKSAYEQALRADPQGRLADRARFGLGRSLLLLGKPDDALVQFSTLTQKGGRDWIDRAWLQSGLAQVKANRDEKAIDAFEQVEKLEPKSPLVAEAKLNRAESMIRLKRLDDAEVVLRSLTADAPQNLAASAALALGTLRLQKDDAAGALAILDEASKRYAKSPMTAALLFRSAEAALKLGQTGDARARFVRASEVEPQDSWAEDALLRASQVTFDQGDLPNASQLAASFVERFPKSTLRADARLVSARVALANAKPKDAITILSASLAEDKPSAPTAQAETYFLGIAYEKDGQSDKSSELLESMDSTAPFAADARFVAGQQQLKAGRYAKAVASLQAYLTAKPDGDVAPHAFAHLVHAKIELKDLDGAFQTLGTFAERYPKSDLLVTSRVRLAEAALSGKRFDQASEQFRLVSDASPSSLTPRAKLGLGWASLDSGKPEEAAVAFAAYLAEAKPDDPLAPEASLARARALRAAKKTDEALHAYLLTAKTYPTSEQAELALLARARLFSEAERPLDAAAAYDQFVQSHPGYKPKSAGGPGLDSVLAEWAWSLNDANKPVNADTVFARLLSEFPDSPHTAEARFNLAESANQSKNYAEVIKLLEPLTAEESKTSPKLLQPVLYRLGRTQAETKNWPAAARTLDRLIAEFPESPFFRQARLLRAEVALESDDPQTADDALAALSTPRDLKEPEAFTLAVRRRRVQSQLGLKKWEDVIKLAESFKADAPGDPLISEVDYARGRALQQLARMDDARAAYQAVIDARKGGDLVARAQFMIGETYYHQENYHEAIRQFLKVDILYDAPTWQAAALLETGKTYERLDQWADAAESYERLRAKFPDDANAQQAKDRLEAARAHLKGNSEKSL